MDDNDAPPDTKPVYVPKRVRALAMALIADQNLDACMAALREMYPNINSYRSALSRIKECVLSTNAHHPGYEAAMLDWKKTVDEGAAIQENKLSMVRVQEFKHFEACSVKRQLRLQKKIALGQGAGFFSHPQDAEFVTNLQIVPEYVHHLRLDAEETRSVQEKQALHMKQLSCTVVRIMNADQLVADARRILKDAPRQKPCDIATAIALTTGRRMIEILQRGSFTEEIRKKYDVLFTGQAKAGLQ